MPLFRPGSVFGVVPLLAMLLACGSDPSGPGPTPPPPPPPPPATPAFTLAVAGGAVAVLQGETANVTVTVTRSGGFTGAVSVAVEGLPAGATATPLTIAGNATSGQLAVVTTNAAALGTATLTLRGTGTGVEPRTVTVGLTVSAPPAAGTYTMSAASGALSVTAGTSGQVTLTLARTGGFAGAVALTATAPAGVTVSFAPASVTGTTSTATISVAAGTAASVVQLTLRGNAPGQPERTVPITLTIAAGGGGGGTGNVAWIFCESAGLPIWLAAQDGTGAWTRVTPTGQEYRFQINGARGGVAYVTPEDAGTVLKVFYGTTAELQAQGGIACAGRTGPARTLTGTVANVPTPGALLLSLGGAQGTATPPGNNFSIARVPSGTIDVLGGASALTFGGAGVSFDLQRLFLRRNINPATNASLGTLDFTGAESFAPATATATITNAGGEFIAVTGSFISTNGLFLTYSVGMGTATAAVPIKGLPGDKRQAGELHMFNISATPSLDPNAGSTRNVGLVFAAMANQTVTYGPTMTMPTVSSLGGGRLQAVYPVQSAYNRYWIASFDQTTIDRRADIEMTSGWLGGAGTVTLAMPDLSGVSGWNQAWALAPGTTASWTVSGTGWDGGNGITSPPFVEGARYVSATQRASIVP
jgi:hypothetical protein